MHEYSFEAEVRVGNFNPNPENPPQTRPVWGGSGMPFFGFGAGLGQLKPAPAGSGRVTGPVSNPPHWTRPRPRSGRGEIFSMTRRGEGGLWG
ncbi:UNVERIFIED_CONTAM: hypothetical protein Sradi_4542200 [Sesamum radiatum]|uniref:Uncharacterized protein n=1 Tax=Sesamum radiatum TaxID=300843 RepID=A0AAW2NBK7_SESRA